MRPCGDLASLFPPQWPESSWWCCICHCFYCIQHRARPSIKGTEWRKHLIYQIKSVSWSKPFQDFLFHLKWKLTSFIVSAMPADHHVLFLHPLRAWGRFLCHHTLHQAHYHLSRISAPTPPPRRSRSIHFWLDLSPEVTFSDPSSMWPYSDSCKPLWQMFLSFYLLVHLSVIHYLKDHSVDTYSVFHHCWVSYTEPLAKCSDITD